MNECLKSGLTICTYCNMSNTSIGSIFNVRCQIIEYKIWLSKYPDTKQQIIQLLKYSLDEYSKYLRETIKQFYPEYLNYFNAVSLLK
jgi:hypothetical protein